MMSKNKRTGIPKKGGFMATKIKLNQTLKALDGKAIKGGTGDGEDFTLKTVICNALGGGYQDERQTLTSSEVVMRHCLSVDIYKAKTEVELTSDEIELIKKLIVKAYPQAIVSGQAILMLDPPPKDRDQKK